VFPLNLYARVRFALCILHMGPRVQRAPGLPCALYLFLGERFINDSDASRREIANTYSTSVGG
jgi:hypothetical protein